MTPGARARPPRSGQSAGGAPDRRPALAAFVSPHGFGHAARACGVLGELARIVPDLDLHLFTTVPEWFFAESLPLPFTHHPLACDVGLIQRTALDEDPAATRAALAHFWPFAPELLARLATELRALGCRAVLADISPLGLAAGRAAGLPTLLVENFTWDWIYGEYLAEEPGLAPFAAAFAALFAAAGHRFRAAPACGVAPGTGVAPISRPPRTPAPAVRARLGIAPDQPLVLVSLGGIPWRFGGLERWVAAGDTVFVVPGGAGEERREGNCILLPHHTPVYHPDLVAAADVVVGKLGYSTVAEAFAAGTRFAWLPRPRFRESAVLAEFVARHLPAAELAPADFASGAWTACLPALLARPRPAPRRENGATAVAAHLAALLAG